MKCNTTSCRKLKKTTRRKRAGFPLFTGLLAAVLPKCPLCISAYSSAMVLCSGKGVVDQQADWAIWATMGLVAFTLLMVLLNYRGKRTWAAAALILIGSAMILNHASPAGNSLLYYLGSCLLFAGVWANASFLYFFRKGMARFPLPRYLEKIFPPIPSHQRPPGGALQPVKDPIHKPLKPLT